ncbi:hypothetical protein ALO_06513 [Acetonema longum DSM 6540]|uniref:Uncharacterized protein n=1 Tax=Acetonema longum DSM 6540 TaxID=1009370 RepID=F7NGW1_9FIRM|nr:hypothetical protein [Acetonema longum]EGO64692.1 hypothetical protein ALO_06513 [Acetonema longum DSM 6540]
MKLRELTPLFKWRQFCTYLNSLIVVEPDIIINEINSMLKREALLPINALRLKNGKEVFCHSVVITIAPS